MRVVAEGADVKFPYIVDARPERVIEVRYPSSLTTACRSLLGPMTAGVGVYLGQLSLAREIHIAAPIDPVAAEDLGHIAEMLYDIRCWKDARPLCEPPQLVLKAPRIGEPVTIPDEKRRSLLMFSGGKDSTLAALALRRNGYDVDALHVPANARVQEAEASAVSRLGTRLRIPASILGFRHDDFIALSRGHARYWDMFPHFNAVPFGRDLLLSLLALPWMVVRGIRTLSMGHDRDCRWAHVRYNGKLIPRNDVESAAGALALERCVQHSAVDNFRMLPPLARIGEFRILREMFERYPDLMRETAFCFWGERCGRCAKCLRYFLAQRLFGREGTLSFSENPLRSGVCPELDDVFRSWGREELLFGTEIVYAMARLVERDDVRPGETRLERFRESILPSVLRELDGFEHALNALEGDPQVPDDFLPVGTV